MEAVKHPQGRMFFLYGYGGTGKTHMWRTLTFALRSQNHIVFTVASSGIASLLLPDGRTAHSKFKILVPTFDNSVCNIHQGSELADLLKQTKHFNASVTLLQQYNTTTTTQYHKGPIKSTSQMQVTSIPRRHIKIPYHEGQVTIPYHEGQVKLHTTKGRSNSIPRRAGQTPYHEGQVKLHTTKGRSNSIPRRAGQTPYHEGQVKLHTTKGRSNSIPRRAGQTPYHEGQVKLHATTSITV
ncbi:hypothetical protein Lal_00030210 [Lupinus albus]|nr:hypothetical protein Lal_00030210 [Lupinus albus]